MFIFFMNHFNSLSLSTFHSHIHAHTFTSLNVSVFISLLSQMDQFYSSCLHRFHVLSAFQVNMIERWMHLLPSIGQYFWIEITNKKLMLSDYLVRCCLFVCLYFNAICLFVETTTKKIFFTSLILSVCCVTLLTSSMFIFLWI